MIHTGKAVLALVLGFVNSTLAHAAPLPRVVSLDSCADQYVLALADDAQIMALTKNAHMAFSYFNERAKAFPAHDGRAESLLAYKPDVVVATGMADPMLSNLMTRVGVKVVATGLSSSITHGPKVIEAFGDALGQSGRAEKMRNDFHSKLISLKALPKLNHTALYLSPGGTTTGAGTFLDEIITLAGFDNHMSQKGYSGWSQLNVEHLVSDAPDVVIGGFFDARVGQADSWRFASHPVIERLMGRAKVINVPSHLISCPAWFSLEAVDMIRNALKGDAPDGRDGE